MINLAVPQNFLDHCNNIAQGMSLSTYVKPCFFIYEQDGENGIIKVDDRSRQISFYDNQTDVHEVFVTVYNSDQTVCYTQPLTPFGNLSFTLPKFGHYIVEIDVRYTIQYDDNGTIIEHTFQNVYSYPVEWETCGDYYNALLHDISCRVSKLQCEINKRKGVGRSWCDLQERVLALTNYSFALCCFSFNEKEFDAIKCAVNKIKKVC
jgi:hypothetical protein